MQKDRTWTAYGLVAIVCLAALSGCGGTDEKEYIPSTDAAREALTAALTAWKDGKPHLTIKDRTPAIEVLVVAWRDGQKLSAFEILGEAPGEDQSKRFNVRLTPVGGAPQEVAFIVIGKDPLKIATEKDWQASMGM